MGSFNKHEKRQAKLGQWVRPWKFLEISGFLFTHVLFDDVLIFGDTVTHLGQHREKRTPDSPKRKCGDDVIVSVKM